MQLFLFKYIFEDGILTSIKGFGRLVVFSGHSSLSVTCGRLVVFSGYSSLSVTCGRLVVFSGHSSLSVTCGRLVNHQPACTVSH
jgi:hypothetical protein